MKSRLLLKQWILKGPATGLLGKFSLQLFNKGHKLEGSIMIKKILALSPFFPIRTLTVQKIYKIHQSIKNQFKTLMKKLISVN